MIVNSTIQRKIYPQNLINWGTAFVPQNNVGYLDFIFSGDSGPEVLFSLNNGKILSSRNNLIGGYASLETLNFSGNIDYQSMDLYQNGEPLYLGFPRATVGDIYNIVLRCSGGSGFDFKNLTVRGDKAYMQTPNNPFLVLYPNEPVRFTINNTGQYDFKILSGSIFNYNFNISGIENLIVPANDEATFYLVYKNSGISAAYQTVAFRLYTDHGTYSFSPVVSGAPTVNKKYSIDLSIPNTYIKSSTIEEYNLFIKNTDGGKIGIGYNYISGFTGDYYKGIITSGQVYNSLVSGYITGSGYLYGAVTGIIAPLNTGSPQYEFSSGSGLVSKFHIADDGPVSGNYLITGSGIGSTIIIGNTIGTGYASSGNYSGIIGVNGGYITGTTTGGAISGSGVINGYAVSGIMENASSTIFIPFGRALTGKFSPDEYYLQDLLSDMVYVTGDFSKNINLIGYGFATGETKQGIYQGELGYNFDPGVYTFHFSGRYRTMISGQGRPFTGFNPVTASHHVPGSPITGLLISSPTDTKVVVGTKYIDLDSITQTETGYVDTFYESGTNRPHTGWDFFSLVPVNNNEFQFENSNTELSGIVDYSKYSNFTGSGMSFTGSGTLLNLARSGYGYNIPNIRTQISRNGNTASGSGFFNNLFQVPFFNPSQDSGQAYPNYKSGEFIGWSETLNAVTSTLQYTGNAPILSYVSGNFGLNDVLIIQGEYIGNDFAEIDLSITGKSSVYSLGFNLKSEQQRTALFVDIYRKPFFSGVTGFIGSGITGITGYRFVPTNTLVNRDSGAYFYITPCNQTCGSRTLSVNNIYNTGEYSIIISGKKIAPKVENSYCSLGAGSYLGFKQNGFFSFNVVRSGYLGFPLSGKLTATINSNYRPFDIEESKPITWNVNFAPGESIKSYGFGLYPDAALQQDWGGTIDFELYKTGCYCGDLFTVPNLITSGSINSAGFMIRDTEQYAVAHQNFVARLSTGCANNCTVIVPVSITSNYVSNGVLYVSGYTTPNASVTITLSNGQVQTVTTNGNGYWGVVFSGAPGGYAPVTITATSGGTVAVVATPPTLSYNPPILPDNP